MVIEILGGQRWLEIFVAQDATPAVLTSRGHLVLSPKDFLRFQIEMSDGTTYAERCGMHELIAYEERRQKVKGGRLPTFASLLARVRR